MRLAGATKSTTLEPFMHAAFYESVGPAGEVLQLAELPDPAPAPGEVRVRVQWSGVNPSDVKSRAGLRSKVMPFPRVIPHSDGMGVIDAVGEGVSAARVGERVWLWNAAWGRANGTAAQMICLPQRQAVPLPEGVSGEAGACLGIPALTAMHAVLTQGGVAGKRVLIAGGAGAASRRSLGTGVFAGMLTPTLVGIFFIPLFFPLIRRFSERGVRSPAPLAATPQTAVEGH